ncbi:cupin domain-containing protein [Thermoproteota archaeon]
MTNKLLKMVSVPKENAKQSFPIESDRISLNGKTLKFYFELQQPWFVVPEHGAAISPMQAPEGYGQIMYIGEGERCVASPHYHTATNETYKLLDSTVPLKLHLIPRNPDNGEIEGDKHQIITMNPGDEKEIPLNTIHYATLPKEKENEPKHWAVMEVSTAPAWTEEDEIAVEITFKDVENNADGMQAIHRSLQNEFVVAEQTFGKMILESDVSKRYLGYGEVALPLMKAEEDIELRYLDGNCVSHIVTIGPVTLKEDGVIIYKNNIISNSGIQSNTTIKKGHYFYAANRSNRSDTAWSMIELPKTGYQTFEVVPDYFEPGKKLGRIFNNVPEYIESKLVKDIKSDTAKSICSNLPVPVRIFSNNVTPPFARTYEDQLSLLSRLLERETDPNEIIKMFNMIPHPEGGQFIPFYRDEDGNSESSMLYLLKGEDTNKLHYMETNKETWTLLSASTHFTQRLLNRDSREQKTIDFKQVGESHVVPQNTVMWGEKVEKDDKAYVLFHLRIEPAWDFDASTTVRPDDKETYSEIEGDTFNQFVFQSNQISVAVKGERDI